MLVFAKSISPRLKYTFQLVLEQCLGLERVDFTSDLEAFEQAQGLARLSYGKLQIEGIPCFGAASLLFETGINKDKLSFKKYLELPAAFYHNEEQSLWPFDPFALIFWLLSRYEEYQDFEADQHDRFTASQSAAYQHGFLQLPLADLWILELKKGLRHFYPQLKFISPKYQFTPSYDIDYAYAFRHKGFLRQLGALGRNLVRFDISTLRYQIPTLLGLRQDPFFTFDYLDKLHEKYQLQPVYFWLLGDHGKYDKNISHLNPNLRRLIRETREKYKQNIGLHPSYRSNENAEILKKEAARLYDIIQQKIIRSRQHFLKLRFPLTYQRLLARGIEEDFSMGYASELGFRASTAHPFFWYDLEKEATTQLKIYPFQVMDVTLNTYLKVPPSLVLEHVLPLLEVTKKVGGHFIMIWHNNSFCEAWQWVGWRAVYEQLLEKS